MGLTNEQRAFMADVGLFKDETRKILKDARNLEAKLQSQIKRFEKLDKFIRDMAKEYNIS